MDLYTATQEPCHLYFLYKNAIERPPLLQWLEEISLPEVPLQLHLMLTQHTSEVSMTWKAQMKAWQPAECKAHGEVNRQSTSPTFSASILRQSMTTSNSRANLCVQTHTIWEMVTYDSYVLYTELYMAHINLGETCKQHVMSAQWTTY